MKTTLNTNQARTHRRRKAFTLPEVLVSVGIVGTMFVSLYAGVSQGFAIVSASRENLRATQIMLEKLEVMRLYTWDQFNEPGFVPTNFTDKLVPTTTAGGTNSGGGTTFYGNIAISDPPGATNYTAGLKQVVITLNWTNGTLARSRQMRTYVGQNGLQQYVY